MVKTLSITKPGKATKIHMNKLAWLIGEESRCVKRAKAIKASCGWDDIT